MSSGPRDARIESDLANDVDYTSLKLAKAIERAKAGHRGFAITDASILESANTVLKPIGFELIRKR